MTPGDVIDGRFELQRQLGRGGNGTVWLARDRASRDSVALKVLHAPTPSSVARFRREAEVLRELDHPGCVRVISSGESPEGPYLAMPFVEGEPLAAFRTARLDSRTIESIAEQICAALAYAHRRGIAHRDLKPENVIITERERGHFKVTIVDFGLAKQDGPAPGLTSTGEFLGTPGYMSPEQIRDPRNGGPLADQYSLGIMLFELYAGYHPYREATTLQVLFAQLSAPLPELPQHCPHHIARVVQRLVRQEPTERFPNFEAAAAALSERQARRVDGDTNDRRLPLAIAAIVALGTIAVAANALRDDAPDVTPSQPTDISALTTPPPGPATGVSPEPTPPLDAGVADAGAACDDAPLEEIFEFEFEGRTREVWVKRPDGSTNLPAAVLLTYRRRHPRAFARRADFQELVARGMVLVGPVPVDPDYVRPRIPAGSLIQDEVPPFVDVWSLDEDPEFIREAVRRAAERHCLDRSRLIGIGHAEGAELLRTEACSEAPGYAALVLSGAADPPDACAWKAQIPVMRIVGKDDKSVPFEGGKGCWGKEVVSSTDTITHIREALNCGAPRKIGTDNRCREFSCGDNAFRSCEVPGGHYLLHSNFARREFRLALAMAEPGYTDPFDPKSCGRGAKMGIAYEESVFRFLEDAGLLSPKTP